MNFSIVYITHRALYRLGDFFHHWYVSGSRYFFHIFISRLEELDKGFAFKVTVKHFFEPLYKDYSILGRILGILFRSGRIVVGGVVYAIMAVVFVVVYLLWISIPIGLIIYAFLKLPS